jgi:tRNA-modifying protein YgfZ
MTVVRAIDLGFPTLLEFRGPDAVRFLNGQVTQDVRKVIGGKISLPSCVTDAKGKLQFRISITASEDGALWVCGLAEWVELLEARLTRYLIADEVEVTDLTGRYALFHFPGKAPEPPQSVVVRESNRYGVAGIDWWLPAGHDFPNDIGFLAGDELEAYRIQQGVPAWGKELYEGLLPPEALLEETDISFQKGCYVGQEVISRIKSAGKVNKRLCRFIIAADVDAVTGPLENGAGEITSLSPASEGGTRLALGYAKRGANDWILKTTDGLVHVIEKHDI